MRQFSIRTVLTVVAIAACIIFGVKRYLSYQANFGWPSQSTLVAEQRSLTPTEIAQLVKGGGDRHTADLEANHPPKGIEYWKCKAGAVEPRMTVFALRRHIPQASRFTSSSVNGLDVDPSRLLCYAVDSEFAIVVWMYYEQMELPAGKTHFGRVKEVIGLFKHNGRLNKYGSLESAFTQNLSLADCIPIHTMPSRNEDEP